MDKKHILKTPTVIADALLGQGEALDCYNQKLQDAAANKALIELEQLNLIKENLLIENQNLQQEITLKHNKFQQEIDLLAEETYKIQTLASIKQSEFNLKKDIIEAILTIDPAQAATLFNYVFTPCCDTPQCDCQQKRIIRDNGLVLTQ